jgi:hypothetical protein
MDDRIPTRMAGLGQVYLALFVALALSVEAHGFGPQRPDAFSSPARGVDSGDLKEPGEMELRILSYNIWGLPGVIGRGNDHSRYRDIGKALAKRRAEGTAPQVVAVQEAFARQSWDLVEEAGYPYVAIGPPGRGMRMSSGLLYLSEYPITFLSEMVFDDCSNVDCFARKGIHHVQIEIPGLPLPIEMYNTHMQASYSEPPSSSTQAARYRQIMQANDFVWDTQDRNSLRFFVGDFNFRTSYSEYGFYGNTAPIYKNAAELCTFVYICSGSDDPERTWRRDIDHQYYMPGEDEVTPIAVRPIFYERNFRERVNGRKLSDHYGHEVHYLLSW